MNAGPADIHSSHLDLADLIAEAAGQPVAARAREHLANCADCRAEADRWNLIGDGVRGVPAATPEAARPTQSQRTLLGRIGPRGLARPVRRVLLAVGSAAAAVVLLGVAGYSTGAVHVHFGQASSTVLTAVGGCSGLEQASGTLQQVNGTSLVIKTAAGQPVTVTTTAATLLGMSGALESDITDGAPVAVAGPSSGGTIAAAAVNVGSTRIGKPELSGAVTVQGTVSDASAAGFTVVTPGGTRVPVITSGSTVVSVANASLRQLLPGAVTMALGYAGPDGTLTARGVIQPLARPVQLRPGVSLHTTMNVRDCTPASLADALGRLAYGE